LSSKIPNVPGVRHTFDLPVTPAVLPRTHTRDSQTIVRYASQPKGPLDGIRNEASRAEPIKKIRYTLSTVLFGGIFVLLFFMPDKTGGKQLASKVGGAAGFGLASGVSYMLASQPSSLQTAAESSSISTIRRVSTANTYADTDTNTYLRLHLGLLGFCVLGLGAFPGEAAFFRTAGPAMLAYCAMSCARLVGAVTAFRGWKAGITLRQEQAERQQQQQDEQQEQQESGNIRIPRSSPQLSLVQEVWKGTKETFRGFKVTNKKKALTYRNIFALVLMAMFSKFMDGMFNIRVRKHALSTDWSCNTETVHN
jgi:hypothetical protein